MHSLGRTVGAEFYKLKRTLALWLAALIPLFVILMQTAILLENSARFTKLADAWRTLTGNIGGIWSVFMLSLFIALLSALLNGLEHQDNHWKDLFGLPLPRWTVYASKVVVAHSLVAFGTVVLWAGTLASGALIHAVRPSIRFGAVPWAASLRGFALMWVAAGLLIALHMWLSMRFRGFPLPLAVGVTGTALALVAGGSTWARFYPWLLAANTMHPERLRMVVTIGVCGGIAVNVLGALTLPRRDVL